MTDTRLDSLERQMSSLSRRLEALEGREIRPAPRRVRLAPPPAPSFDDRELGVRPTPRPPRRPLEDFATPRNLAIAGGLAVTLGLGFLVSYAVSNGWISETLRVILATMGSAGLAGAGFWLVERRGQHAPAMALMVSGLVGMFLTVVAATRLYELVSIELGVALATLVGIAAMLAALRRNSEAIACLALGGTLLSPLLVGADYTPATLAFLAPVYALAMAISVVRSWPAAFVASFAIMLPSLAVIQDGGAFTAPQAFGLAFAGTLLTGSGLVGRALLDRSEQPWQAPTYGVVGGLLGILGYLLISGSAVPLHGDAELPATLAKLWLFSFAALSGVCIWASHERGLVETRRAALTVAVGGFAWGLGEVVHGPALVLAWSASAAVTVAAARHDWERGLALCVAALAVGHVLLNEIPLDALVNGVDALSSAWIAGIALMAAAASMRVFGPASWRPLASTAAFGLLVYLVSVTIVDLSQTNAPAFGPAVSALDSEARGQVMVSSLWAICGLLLVVVGLRRQRSAWRSAGLSLLALAGAKIALFDLSALSTAARTISFIVVGMILLATAFAYQAMTSRPEKRTRADAQSRRM